MVKNVKEERKFYMILKDQIIREGHPTLRTRAEEVKFPLSEENRKLAFELMEYIKNSQDEDIAEKFNLRPGIGLAANQVNELKRMFALHLQDDKGEQVSFVAINPRIVSHSVENTYLTSGEGCLSVDRPVPGYVPRHARITVKFFDTEGTEHKMRLTGLPAIAFQHELDHLNGVMFFDRINEKDPFGEIENGIPFER